MAKTPLQLYEQMLFIRLVEEEMASRYGAPGQPQEMRCPVHLSIGQEAAAVGTCAAMTHEDHAYSTHRCHAHYLAKGGALDRMLGEIYGKQTGCLGGRGGSMHLMDMRVGMQASIPIVSSVIPLAVGAALAMKMDGKPHLTAVFFGDGAMEEGAWHEAANFARLRQLPVLFICENNLYSVYTPLHLRQPDGALARFARAHELPMWEADGMDVEASYEATQAAVASIRAGNGPALVLLDTYRFREHCGPNDDDHLGYRASGELEQWHQRDPLERQEARLIARGDLTREMVEALKTRLTAEIAAGFEQARAAPLPTPDTAFDYVYA